MSGRKETRPSAATLRRAAENGSVRKTAQLSATNDTTPAAFASSSSERGGTIIGQT